MDSYQAIYDAVRSKISHADSADIIGGAVREAFDFSHARAMLQEQIYSIGAEMVRLSVLWRSTVAPDGTKWCALYGPDLAEGISGFGDTPDEAMRDFDQNWFKQQTPVAVHQIRKIEEEECREQISANSQFGVGA